MGERSSKPKRANRKTTAFSNYFSAVWRFLALFALWVDSKMWYYLDMISKIFFAVSVVFGVGILWMLNFTSPAGVGPIGVLGFFGLLYGFIFCIFSLFSYGVGRLFGMIIANMGRKNPVQNKGIVFYSKYMSVVAFSTVVVVAQQSVGGVGILEIILLVILSGIACIFISKR